MYSAYTYIFIYVRDASAHHNSKVLQGYPIMLSVLRFYERSHALLVSFSLPLSLSLTTLQSLFPPLSFSFPPFSVLSLNIELISR